MKRGWTTAAAAAAVMAFAHGAPARAVEVLLSFEGLACTNVDGGPTNQTCTTSGNFIGADYGSTTGLAVSYDAADISSGQRTSLQFRPAFAFGIQGASAPVGGATAVSSIFFTPAAGYEVSFRSFVYGRGTATTSTPNFTLTDAGGNTLFDVTLATNLSRPTYTADTAYFSGPLTFNFYSTTGGLPVVDEITLDVRPVAVVTPVPEPATWAMMIGGFGLIGGALRGRRASVLAG